MFMKWKKSLTIKQSYRLSWKALHPHSIERQNVKLAFRIFFLLIKAIGCFVNVLLNDYGIYKTNQNIGSKVVRKLSKLN